MKRHAPAAERNQQAILEVLARVLSPAGGLLLEIASGSGQHAVHLARGLPAWTVQPTDVDRESLSSIEAWVSEAVAAGVLNLRQPRLLDVRSADPELPGVDAIFNANMIHISAWDTTLGLLAAAARWLPPGGPLLVYGPFMRSGRHTAPSNASFDDWLRAQDPAWGVRDLDVVTAEARSRGLLFEEAVEMPANNLTVLFRRG